MRSSSLLVALCLLSGGLIAQQPNSIGSKHVADAAERLTGHRSHMFEEGVAVARQERREEILAVAARLQRDEQALLPLIARYGSYLCALRELGNSGGGRR